MVTHTGTDVVQGVKHTTLPKGRAQMRPKFGVLPTYAHTVWRRTTKCGVVKYMTCWGACFRDPMGWAPTHQNFWRPIAMTLTDPNTGFKVLFVAEYLGQMMPISDPVKGQSKSICITLLCLRPNNAETLSDAFVWRLSVCRVHRA